MYKCLKEDTYCLWISVFKKTTFLLCGFFLFACQANLKSKSTIDNNKNNNTNIEHITTKVKQPIQLGASRFEDYLPIIGDKSIGLVVNQTSLVGETHLVDTLLTKGVNIKAIFAPEHGFRGEADAGEQVKDGKDATTQIPLISLYGKKKKPSTEDLADIELMIFDIQDVGARFYTYISSMHYVMEACAEQNIPFLVLDRPNPNGNYVDGPILESTYQSFVGMHPVPIVHGMTIGEYARMINGEGWLKNGVRCQLTVVPCANYTHDMPYELPVRPSPNLPNMRSIYLYPSLCLFEGTSVSVGRGTTNQFQIYGHPDFTQGDYQFTPVSSFGAKYPKHENKVCYGYDLTQLAISPLFETKSLNLNYLIEIYHKMGKPKDFFLSNGFFNNLAGTATLRQQIEQGLSAEAIKASWKADLDSFIKIRANYLMY